MHDVFEPVARVMTNLQSISAPPWKAYHWVQQLIEWLKEASLQCRENGDMDFFPKIKVNAEVLFTSVVAISCNSTHQKIKSTSAFVGSSVNNFHLITLINNCSAP